MDDTDEMYIAEEERDPERLEEILRHSSVRPDGPVMLVQLPNSTLQRTDDEFPLNRADRRRATIVNIAGTPQAALDETMDPFNWHFHRNTPDLRHDVREGAADELTSRRKSRIGGDPMEQMDLILSNQNVNRHPASLNKKENEYVKSDNENNPANLNLICKDKIQTSASLGIVARKSALKSSDAKLMGKDDNERYGQRDGEELYENDTDEEPLPVIDTILSSLNRQKENAVPPKLSFSGGQKPSFKDSKISFPAGGKNAIVVMQASSAEPKTPFKETVISSTVSRNSVCNKGITVKKAVSSYVDRKSSSKGPLVNPVMSCNKDITVMPAEYSLTDQNSPFKKTRDEIRPRPSSRVRVLIMVDEWGEDDRFDDENRRNRQAKGEGKGGRDRDRRGDKGGGKRFDDRSDYMPDARQEYIYDKSPLEDKRRGKAKTGRRSEDDEYGRNKDGDRSRGGRKHSYGDEDWDERGKRKRRSRPGTTDYEDRKYVDDDGKGKRGRRSGDRDYGKGARSKGRDGGYDDDNKGKWGGQPGDRDYDKSKYGDGARPGGRDGRFDDDDKNKWGGRPGDRDYDKSKYGDGTRPGGRDGRFDDDDKNKWGGGPGDRDYDKNKYGDGTRPGGRDGRFDDDDKNKWGGRPGDRDYDKSKYGDGTRPGGRDGRFDDDDKNKWGGRPGDRDYDKRKYGDGTRPGERDGSFDDDDKDKRGGRPGDRVYDKRKYGDGTRPGGRDDGGRQDSRDGDRGGKPRPGGDNDGAKYRTVTMPRSATTLTSRRRYHLQVTDHEMKEPWFNSCFNISQENNVDLNYEGPVKITPYYVADKFS